MNTEKTGENYRIETEHFIVEVEFGRDIDIWIKENDEFSTDKRYLSFENSEKLNDFTEIIKKINSLNLEG